MGDFLLATKICTPSLRVKTVNRTALSEKISCGIESGCRLTLISAPAGSGKTTVINQWIKTTSMYISWVSLDDTDNDPVVFFQYLIASLQKINKGIGTNALSMFGGPFLPYVRSVMISLINDLCELSTSVAIILDDYHTVKSSYINEFMQEFIENLPELIHIVILSREDPHLQFSKLRVSGEITELRANDLSFNEHDAFDFFTEVLGMNINKSTVDKFLQRTEGWIAGLQLAALSVRNFDKKKADEFADRFGENNCYIIDYLVEEVLDHLPASMRDFICATVILERMNADLCDFITNRNDSALVFRELIRLNLFLIPLDDSDTWFRYHHLFANSIRSGIKKEDIRELCGKAAAWFGRSGYTEEAIHYALKAENVEETLRYIELLIPDYFENARLPTFLSLLDHIPNAAVLNSPIIAIKKGWALLISGNINGVQEFMGQLNENFVSNLNPLEKGLYLGLLSILANYKESSEAENLAKQALELIGDKDVTAKIAVLNTLADAQKRRGKTKDALISHELAYNAAKPLGYTYITLLAIYQYGMTLDILGKRKEAKCLTKDLLDDMMRIYNKPIPLMGVLYALLALLEYEENRLDKAEDYAEKAQMFLTEMSLTWIININITMVNIRLTQGKISDAERLVESTAATSNGMNFKLFEFRNATIMADICMRSGRVSEALEWAEHWALTPDDKPNATREQWYFTYVRILLMSNRLEEASKLIDYLEYSITAGARLGRIITLFILKSIFFSLRGNSNAAAEYMSKAIEYAAPQEYTRAFLDEGKFVLHLLQALPNHHQEFARSLIDISNSEPTGNTGWTDFLKPMHTDDSVTFGLVEKLSDREIEILSLIAQGMTNNTISSTLYISVNTTQWHITNIYGKLGVKNRVQALKKAKELNLI